MIERENIHKITTYLLSLFNGKWRGLDAMHPWN